MGTTNQTTQDTAGCQDTLHRITEAADSLHYEGFIRVRGGTCYVHGHDCNSMRNV